MAHVSRILQSHPFDPIYLLKPRLDHIICHFIISPIQKQGIYLYLVGLRDSLPVFQRPSALELGRALPEEMSVEAPALEGVAIAYIVLYTVVSSFKF